MRTIILAMLSLGLAGAQTAAPPAFDVASVKLNTATGGGNSNIPLGPGDAFTPTGGFFNATGIPVSAYIAFAYKLNSTQIRSLFEHAPEWVMTERYDIQARGQGNPSKDQMRMMMRTLLADRFQLAIRTETREVPVAALVLVKEGKLGPQIQAHPADQPCPLDAAPGAVSPDPRFPLLCGGLLQMPPSAPGRLHFGGRNVTLEFMANALSAGTSSGRPMADRTGLDGKFDFNLEFTMDTRAPGADAPPEQSGPSFEQALREQLGFKLESQKGSISVYVMDKIERPTGN